MVKYTINNLTKKFNHQEVIHISHLSIEAGMCIGIVGSNGAGKTTLFRLILDLLQRDTGTIFFEGKDIMDHEEWKNYIGAYIDENMLLSFLTPDEYFETLRQLYHMSHEQLQLKLALFSSLFNNELVGKRKYIRDLSKGNIKKTGIAAALIHEPQVVLLDEPFENLDPASQINLQNLFTQLKTETQTTFIVTSHNITHITEISDRIIVLEQGKIVLDIHEKSTMKTELESFFYKR